jgi:hypothetical protein
VQARETQQTGSEMTEKQDKSLSKNSPDNPDDSFIAERVQELTWALLDEQINDDEFMLLENLLLSDDKARDTYLGCTRLHADLMAHFAGPPVNSGSNVGSGSQILGFLNSDAAIGFESPSAEEATQ